MNFEQKLGWYFCIDGRPIWNIILLPLSIEKELGSVGEQLDRDKKDLSRKILGWLVKV